MKTPEKLFDEQFHTAFEWVVLNCKDEIIAGVDMNNLEVNIKNFFSTHYISKQKVKDLITKEINIANKEGQPTSRLTSLFNNLSE